MTHPIKPLLATAAVLALAACSATNVGESWQCPLAQGPGCSTVAEADPALPRETAKAEPAPGGPLYRPRRPPGLPPAGDGTCGGECGGGFDPLGWLAGLLRGIAGDGEEPSAGAAGAGETGAEGAVAADEAAPPAGATGAPSIPPRPAGSTIPAASTGAGASGPLPGKPVPAVPEPVPGDGAADGVAVSAAPPAGSAPGASPLPAEPVAGGAVAPDAELRAPEVIGRIWIAPFVDADGHYREGAWVRTVLEPAGWRLR